ncbi:MAG: 16S rRNA (uracil(1498)-N(3))-methyltransferase [Marinirhabdus sp.]
MQLFYQPQLSENDTTIVFGKGESRHLGKVLRKKENDVLHVTNGNGLVFKARVLGTAPKKFTAQVILVEKKPPRPYYLHLAVAPTKLNDRYEWFLEKATEVGIHAITPITCHHSERTTVKTERYEKIIQSAMKQSLQAYLPKLNPPMPLKDFFNIKHVEDQTYIAHCGPTEKKPLKAQLRPNGAVLVLVGPEGGFSPTEIETAVAHNFTPVSLGSTRLRTETAAVVACHSVAFVNGV